MNQLLPLPLPGIPDDPQYRRLFGALPLADIAAQPPLSALPLAGDDDGPRMVSAIDAIALLRAKHFERGHTPQSDARHGSTHFWHGVHAFWWKAMAATDPVKRRNHLIAAAAMIVAQIDAEDFQRTARSMDDAA
jgi:hypothetical protein